jgi:hypothetical protein
MKISSTMGKEAPRLGLLAQFINPFVCFVLLVVHAYIVVCDLTHRKTQGMPLLGGLQTGVWVCSSEDRSRWL